MDHVFPVAFGGRAINGATSIACGRQSSPNVNVSESRVSRQ